VDFGDLRSYGETMESDERLCWDVSDVSRLLHLSRNSVYLGCIKGEIPHVKIGKRILIPKVQLERLLLSNSRPERADHES